MKRDKKWISFIAVFLVFACVAIVVKFRGDGETLYQVNFEREISVQNGIADPISILEEIYISKEGDYQMHFEWVSAPGMITGVRLLNAEGEVLAWMTGESVDADMDSIFFEEGDYIIEFVNLVSAEDYTEFVEDSSHGEQDGLTVTKAEGEVSDIREYEFVNNGTFRNSYAYKISGRSAWSNGKTLGVVVGVIVGFIISVVILIFTKKDKRLESEYDERQQEARGQGYCIGFWTAFMYFGMVTLLDIAEIKIPAENSVIIFTGMILSGFVFCAYCIWTSAYFAMNDNGKALGVVFLLIGLMNFGIGIFGVVHGSTVVNGIVTFRALNLICGIFMAAIGVVLVVKKLVEDKGDDEG